MGKKKREEMTKRKRRRGTYRGIETSGIPVDMIESRPTDPADLDELIEAARDLVKSNSPLAEYMNRSMVYECDIDRLRKALEVSDER